MHLQTLEIALPVAPQKDAWMFTVPEELCLGHTLINWYSLYQSVSAGGASPRPSDVFCKWANFLRSSFHCLVVLAIFSIVRHSKKQTEPLHSKVSHFADCRGLNSLFSNAFTFCGAARSDMLVPMKMRKMKITSIKILYLCLYINKITVQLKEKSSTHNLVKSSFSLL